MKNNEQIQERINQLKEEVGSQELIAMAGLLSDGDEYLIRMKKAEVWLLERYFESGQLTSPGIDPLELVEAEARKMLDFTRGGLESNIRTTAGRKHVVEQMSSQIHASINILNWLLPEED